MMRSVPVKALARLRNGEKPRQSFWVRGFPVFRRSVDVRHFAAPNFGGGRHEGENDVDVGFEGSNDFSDAWNIQSEHGSVHHNRGSRRDSSFSEEGGEERLWLDPSIPVADRVARYTNRNLGTLHPLDIVLASVDLIRDCGRMRSFEGMQYARDILDRLLDEKRFVNQQKGRAQVIVPENVFTTVMYGWSNLSRHVKFGPQRMREILTLMIEEHTYDNEVSQERTSLNVSNHDDHESTYGTISCQPTIAAYSTLIQGLAEASHRSIAAAVEAEEVLRRMGRVHRSQGWHTKPNTKCFTLVINAYARTCHPTCGDRAEAVLRRMIDMHEKEKQAYLEDVGMEYDFVDPTKNKRAIVTPDVIAYGSTMNAHSQSGADKSADKVFALLLEMLQSNSEYAVPDSVIFTNAINAFAKIGSKKRSPKERMAAAERAEHILWLMINEIKREKDATKEAGKLGEISDESTKARKEKSLAGDIAPFNACIKAWAQSNVQEAPYRAEALVQKLLDVSMRQTTDVRPDTISFNMCLQAWARAARNDPNAPQKAEELLQMMLSVNDDAGSHVARPDVQSYTIVMNAYGQSRDIPNKVKKARAILTELVSSFSHNRSAKISSVPFTVVLNAAAHSESKKSSAAANSDAFGLDEEGSEDPYEIALQTYREMQEDLFDIGISPDHIAYSTMIEVIGRHTDPLSIERKQRIEMVFQDARMNGSVSCMVVQALQKWCNAPDVVQSLLQTKIPVQEMETVNMLPLEWTRNVPQKFRKMASRRRDFKEKR